MVEALSNFLTGAYRKSRFHDEKGNFVDLAGLPNAVPAFFSAAGKRLFGLRPNVPMISFRGRREIEFLLTKESHIIEFGSGNSTQWFAARVAQVLSIEDDPAWFEHVRKQLVENGIQNVRHELRTKATYADLSEIEDGSIDFALVDGTDREGCIKSVMPKLKKVSALYLDNSDKDMTKLDGDLRRAEKALLEGARNRGGSVRYFSDFSPTNFFVEQGMLVKFS